MKYGTIDFNSNEFSCLFRVNPNHEFSLGLHSMPCYKIEKVICNTDSRNQLLFKEDPENGILWGWKYSDMYGFIHIYDPAKIIEFNDDEDALLWFKLNYGG